MKKNVLVISAIALILISVIFNINQYRQITQLKRDMGSIYASSLGNLSMNTDLMLDYLTNGEPLNRDRIDFYTTKLNEMKVGSFPSNIAIEGCITLLYSNFTAISQKLKAGELKAKSSLEIYKSVQVLKLLENELQKIKQECQDNSILYYELTNPNNQLAVELDTELKDGLISIINSKE